MVQDYNEKKYREDLSNLLNYCRKKGFRDAEIEKDSIYYSENKKDSNVAIEFRSEYLKRRFLCMQIGFALKPYPDKPVGAQRKSRFIGVSN